MKKTVILLSLFAALLSTAAFGQTESLIKDQLGVTRMKAVYPEPDSQVKDGERFSIAADFSALETPIDTTTVVILLNGINITQACEITSSYAIYEPDAPLQAGEYDVRITAKYSQTIDKITNLPVYLEVEPLTWAFKVGNPAPGTKPQPAVAKKPSNSEGKLAMTTSYVMTSYTQTPSNNPDPTINMSEIEGMKTVGDFNFTNVSDARTVTGVYHRDVQGNLAQSNDTFRFQYTDQAMNANIGHFRVGLSDLTYLPSEMLGVKVDKTKGRLSMSAFSGRSQNPQGTLDILKQFTTGARVSFSRTEKSKTTLMALTSSEIGDITQNPRDDKILSLLQEFKLNQQVSALFEGASSLSGVRADILAHSKAERASITRKTKNTSQSVQVYNIPDTFLPLAESLGTRINSSNKKGATGNGRFQLSRTFSSTFNYQKFRSLDSTKGTDYDSKIGNYSLTYSPKHLPGVTWNQTKSIITSGSINQVKSANLNYKFARKLLVFRDSRVSLNGGKINSSTYDPITKVVSGKNHSRNYGGVFGAAFSDKLNFRSNLSRYETTSSTLSTPIAPTTNTITLINELNWSPVPDKLSFKFTHNATGNKGNGTDNKKRQFTSKMTYAANDFYSYTLGLDTVSYTDKISNPYNFSQVIVRAGVEYTF